MFKRTLTSDVLFWGVIGVIVFVVLLLTIAPAMGQEGTPDAPMEPGDQVSDLLPAEEHLGEVPPEEAVEPAGLLILVMISAGVTGLMEFLKRVVLKGVEARLSSDAYAALLTGVGLVLSAFIIFISPPEINIFAITGLYPDIDLGLARVLTAIGIFFGEDLLHVLYEFLRAGKSQRAVQVAANTPNAVNINNRL